MREFQASKVDVQTSSRFGASVLKVSAIVLVLVSVGLVTYQVVSQHRQTEKALTLVRKHAVGTGLTLYEKPVSEYVSLDSKIASWMRQRLGQLKVIGWKVRSVEAGYLISFEFDEGNGIEGYFFEVSSIGSVRSVNGNAALAHEYGLVSTESSDFPGKLDTMSSYEEYQYLRCSQNVSKQLLQAVYPLEFKGDFVPDSAEIARELQLHPKHYKITAHEFLYSDLQSDKSRWELARKRAMDLNLYKAVMRKPLHYAKFNS